ncbi:MAG: hypothetical protein HY262_00575 [Chloroflexi bacterium]|nr:hypothetical protein [Chloroflexota bacterium]
MSSSFSAALLVALAVFVVHAWLALVSTPPVRLGLSQTANGDLVVSEVPVAEGAWLGGVRPGMAVANVVPPTDPASWESLTVSDGPLLLTIQRDPLPPDAVTLTPGLVALLLAALAYRSAPGIAFWLLAVPALASLAAASDLVPAVIGFGLVLAPVAVGALFVIDRNLNLPRISTAAAMFVLAAVGIAWLVAYGQRFDSWAVPRLLSAGTALGLLAFVSVAVARHASWRARSRLARNGNAAPAIVEFLGATADELIPGRSRSRVFAIESERSRLANDIHAEVMPALAEVIQSADTSADPATATRLRAVAAELRDLMTERRLPVLEELGLVPALEWLAERVEERTNVRVEIDIQGDNVQRAPRDVELAAYRIAQQALDNALIHARAHTIRIDVNFSGQRLELEIVDDGLGLPPDAETRALRAGHLGLADMRSRAAAIGGTFRIAARPGGGTTAALRWPA